MSAAALTKAGAEDHGPRPTRLRTDLGAIADLVEICFQDELDAGGRAAIREMRLLSHTGPLLWLLAGLNRMIKGLSTGFVWVEDGRLVGNVSIYRADVAGPAWVIANVAVHPDYRQRGIARHLMRVSLDRLRGYGAHWVDLQVKRDNEVAIALYRGLGFYKQETWVTWRRPAHLAPPSPSDARPDEPHSIRAARGSDWRAIYDLACLTRPKGLGWMRPLTPQAFKAGFWRRLSGFFGGRRERYLVSGPDGSAQAALLVELPMGRAVDRMVLMVHPSRRGYLEKSMLAFALRRWQGRRKSFVIEHPDDDWAGTEALEALQFERQQTLVQMRLDLK